MDTTTIDSDNAFESLIGIIDGTRDATADDMQALLGSGEGREAWADLQDIGDAVGRKYAAKPDKDKAWKAFAERVGKRRRKARIVRIVAMAAAAAAAIALLLTMVSPSTETVHSTPRQKVALSKPKAKSAETHAAAVAKLSQKAAKPAILAIGTNARETRHLMLADGTEVWLNAGSSLSYPERFSGAERCVSLRGEAYFKVSHDPAHPFIIEAGRLRARVLGTEFNVRCYKGDDTHVTLVSGSVEVSAGGSVVRISPSEDATIEDGGLRVSRVSIKDFTSWRHGIMYFDNASLRAILQEMGSWYGVNVICNDNGLLERRFHFMYNRNAPVEEGLRLLNDASDVNVALEDGAIVIE